jgi:hypothetical protein
MDEVVIVEKAPEVVIPLSAMLETPNEPEETEVDTTAGEVKVEAAEVKLEEKIVEAKEAGASKEELNELRGLLRELRNDNISLKTRLAAAERVQNGDLGTDGKEAEVTEIEYYRVSCNRLSRKTSRHS